MKRYYLHQYVLDDTILIDTKDRTWTFYETNMYGQFHNLNASPKKITGQRIAGLRKRLSISRYDADDGFVVDQFIHQYFFTEEEREKYRTVYYSSNLIASEDSLHAILEIMCKNALANHKNSKYVEQDYYKKRIKDRVLLEV